ncbi:hypothetical protein MTO96_003780 [Rhipicephalus appendiculatus]
MSGSRPDALLSVTRTHDEQKDSQPSFSVPTTSKSPETSSNSSTAVLVTNVSQRSNSSTASSLHGSDASSTPSSGSSEYDNSDYSTESELLDLCSFDMAPEIAGPLLQFPIDLYRQMRLHGNQRNLLLSPWLVSFILVMVHHGARGDTATKIARLLHASYCNWRKGELLERFVRWTRDLPAGTLGPRHGRAGLRLTRYACLYHAEAVKLTDEYVADMERVGVNCHRKDFACSAEQCRLSMDAFARAMTSYTIAAPGQALRREDVNRKTQLVFVGLIREQVRWWRRFERAPDGLFFETRDRTSVVAMMTQTAPFSVCDSPELGATLVELPFESPHQSLVILLPNDVEGLASVEDKMSASKILHCLGMLKEQGDAVVTLPRFSVKCVTDLKHLLGSMGKGDVFAKGADLSGLCASRRRDVAVSTAKQFVFFQAGRNGPVPAQDELSSLTVESTTSTLERHPRRFTVDRPFLFLVVGREPDIVFLFGSVRRIS